MFRGSSRVLWGLVLTGLACAHGPGSGANDGTSPPMGTARVHVINHYKDGMEVFASGSGIVQRLGLVAAGAERDFVLPHAIVDNGSLLFMAQPTAYGPIVRSEPLRIVGGDVVDFVIATSLVGSQANARPR